MSCFPAVHIAHPSRTEPDAVPPAPDVTEVVTDALEAAGWTSPTDILRDVREGVVDIQDEVPPADPVDWYCVTVAFGQVPMTFTHGYDGPFRVAVDAIHREYPDMEIYLDAVEA